MRHRTIVALLALTLACGTEPSPDPRVAASEEAANRALAYLSSTRELVSVDVVVAMLVYAEVSGDALAESLAERRLRLVPDEAIRAFGPALGAEHPTYEPEELWELEVDPSEPPDPHMTLDDRDQTCPLEALSCQSSPECEEYLDLDLWGYPLTHQALTLVFAQWGGCEAQDDAMRQRIGGRLQAAQRANPGPSDLASERMAMLGQLGFGDAIEDTWVESLIESQSADGAFFWEAGDETHPHPTGVGLWALASWRRGR
ncbi:MAG: hypothetical protein AB8H86_26920 [Polyangiales bacterium]